MRSRLVVAVVLFLCVTTVEAARIEKKSVMSKGEQRPYYLFVPDGLTADHPAPLLLLLHGSGRDGKTQVEPWQRVAEREGIILVAPDASDRRMWRMPEDGPELFRDLVEELKKSYPVDEKRVYLFGHSAGACFAIQMGALESEYFAAVAAHAGAVEPKYYSVFDNAARKLPIGIWVGDRDAFFPLELVRGTRDELARRMFPVQLKEMRGHDHNYYVVARSLNEEIWNFLKTSSLDKGPRFQIYGTREKQ